MNIETKEHIEQTQNKVQWIKVFIMFHSHHSGQKLSYWYESPLYSTLVQTNRMPLSTAHKL